MKPVSERNPLIVGLVGCSVTAGLVLAATQYDKIPFVNSEPTYSAYFAEAGGLAQGSDVNVAGYQVGRVSSVKLYGDKVVVTFTVDENIRVGDRTEATIKTKTLLGAKSLELTPAGDGVQDGPIPLGRTVAPYQLPDALGDITETISGLNTDQLSQSLLTVSDVLGEATPQLRDAAEGVARFSQVLNTRDDALRNLLKNANKVSAVLGQRSRQIAELVTNTNTLLAALRAESDSLDQILINVSALSHQVSGLIDNEREKFKPALDSINDLLTLVANRKDSIQKAIPMLGRYAMSLGETVGSGPFFKAYLGNLLPGQFVQPFIDAAFSDLGLDPHTLLPSEREDPATGQAATPPLPLPYPRTGRGGSPPQNLPDAITGNPGDQGCGPPGLPLPGPTGCYPYREPVPPSPPGAPPPAAPAPDDTPVWTVPPVPTSTDLAPPPPQGQP